MYFNATLKFKTRNILTYISNNDNLANQNLFFSIVRKRNASWEILSITLN